MRSSKSIHAEPERCREAAALRRHLQAWEKGRGLPSGLPRRRRRLRHRLEHLDELGGEFPACGANFSFQGTPNWGSVRLHTRESERFGGGGGPHSTAAS